MVDLLRETPGDMETPVSVVVCTAQDTVSDHSMGYTHCGVEA